MLDIKVGDVYRTYRGCEFVVVNRCGKSSKFACKFLDSFGYEFNAYTSLIKSGEIKNPFLPTILGVGYLGVGKYKTNSKEYRVWCGLLKRCYTITNNKPIRFTVDERWNNFQVFAEWLTSNGDVIGTLLPLDYEKPVYEDNFMFYVPDKPSEEWLNRDKRPYNYNPLKVGDRFKSRYHEDDLIEVVEYNSHNDVVYKFVGLDDYTVRTTSITIKQGGMQNPMRPSVCGVGYLGVGRYGKDKTDVNLAWRGMLSRCYNENNLAKNSTYKGCSVSEQWHNFQNFAEWYESQYREDGWQIDKDILVRGNRVYSEDTCALVPREINVLTIKRNSSRGELPIGLTMDGDRIKAQFSCLGKIINLGFYDTEEEGFEAYKQAKETHIKYMANVVYGKVLRDDIKAALNNYEVLITD